MTSPNSERRASLTDAIVTGLSPWVSTITVQSVLSMVARRAGMRSGKLEESLDPKILEEIVRALSLYVRNSSDLENCRRVLRDVSERRRSAAPSAVEIPITCEQDIVVARTRVRDLARALGFQHTDQIKIATAVSELSRNIYSYAGSGVVSAAPARRERSGIVIRAVDRGPGIRDIDHVLSGNYSSKTGMGLGLRGCKQMMDTFQVVTGAGRGTHVTMEKFT